MMFNEKEIEKINRFLSNQTFECRAELGTGMGKYNFEYQFAITGIKQMISFGFSNDHVKIYTEIIDIEDKFKKFFTILGEDLNREQLTNIFFKNDYKFRHSLNECINETLKYLTSDEFVRISFDNIILSDNLYKEIINI